MPEWQGRLRPPHKPDPPFQSKAYCGRILVLKTGATLVVGTSKLASNVNSGYWTSYSTNGGASWNGSFLVNGSATGGATSRIVWSASGFHAFILDTRTATWVLQHWQSSDGQTWARQSDIARYTMPLASSPTNVVTCCPSGELSYAYTPDAVASSGLGWVVAYPVNVGGYNAINVSTELGGGTTITYTTDLFNADITTSLTRRLVSELSNVSRRKPR